MALAMACATWAAVDAAVMLTGMFPSASVVAPSRLNSKVSMRGPAETWPEVLACRSYRFMYSMPSETVKVVPSAIRVVVALLLAGTATIVLPALSLAVLLPTMRTM